MTALPMAMVYNADFTRLSVHRQLAPLPPPLLRIHASTHPLHPQASSTATMKYTAALTTLAVGSMAAAVPAPAPADAPWGLFGVTASHSGSVFHLSSLTARGNYFYLGGESSSVPSGKPTVFAGVRDGLLGLKVKSVHGQQVYVEKSTGKLAYNQLSSSIPQDAISDKFSRKLPGENPEFGTLDFTQGGLVACPTGADKKEWQVYAQINGPKPAPCEGFNALTTNVTSSDVQNY